ncbi:MAG: ATP-dependent DNA helicase [Deltaproteobacteria bacterium]|nr:ATP-dependent DNA helicase [Deltaproteobacteria bacterium]
MFGLDVDALLGPGGVADRLVPDWEVRDAQLEVARAIHARLVDGGQVVIEAPTGVGKTLGYLVPAVLSGRRVVISTNTKTLQDQIIHKDLPALARMFAEVGVELVRADAELQPEPGGRQVHYALMKGRNNYLCLDRLHNKTRQRSFDFDSDLLSELAEWARTSPRGDRAELAGLSESSPLWNELDARSEICHGARCAHYESCFVVRMRREAANAQLIIVNHHLLLADLALKAQAQLQGHGRAFGEVIPSADALILDEAHTLEETASEYFGGQVSTRKLERLAKDLDAYLGEGGARRDRTRVTFEVAQAVSAAEAVFSALPRGDGRVRLSRDGAARALAGAQRALPEMEAAFLALVASLDADALEVAAAEGLSRRTRDILESVRFVLAAEDPDFVYWTERQPKHATLGASPIRVSNLLSQFMFESFDAVALTSATLSAGKGDARYFREAVGVHEEAETLMLESPFDFPSQAALYLPKDAPEPTAPGAAEALAEHAEALIDLVGGGALFLFTSYRVMHAVHRILQPRLRYPVFMQGERPKRALLEDMVTFAPAVLFATASFWEGVDLPGDPLKLVIIDRLPFDSPTDPLVAARGEVLEQLGKSSFNSLLLPRAILRLRQGFGRLVRSRRDRGVVAILDRRVTSKGYGRRFLDALPPAQRVDDLEGLALWWRGAGPEDASGARSRALPGEVGWDGSAGPGPEDPGA